MFREPEEQEVTWPVQLGGGQGRLHGGGGLWAVPNDRLELDRWGRNMRGGKASRLREQQDQKQRCADDGGRDSWHVLERAGVGVLGARRGRGIRDDAGGVSQGPTGKLRSVGSFPSREGTPFISVSACRADGTHRS